MKCTTMLTKMKAAAVSTGAVLLLAAVPAMAQYYPQAPVLGPQQMDGLVSRIALYPDPLLAQVLAAATFPDDIQDAARWSFDHRYLSGDQLADAIENSNLPWDPSIQALLPFPDVLDTMARDMNWTVQLGNAFLAQRDDVMDAVQRMRRLAQSYGYLRSSDEVRVIVDPGYIQIMPYDPAVIYVPVYDPYVVYAPPRPGIYIGTVIGFHRGFALGMAFGHWGWGGGFDWRAHRVIVHERVWDRNWANRGTYVHNWGNWDNGRWRDRRNTVVVRERETVVDRGASHRDNGYRPVPPPPSRRDNNIVVTHRETTVIDRGGNRTERPAPRMENSYRPSAPPARVENNRPSAPPRVETRHEAVRQEAPRPQASPGMSRGGGNNRERGHER